MNIKDYGTNVPLTDSESSVRAALARKAFLQCLMNGDGEPFGLNYDKFVGRCNDFKEAEDHPGKFVISVERHRAIAGCTYSKGSAMAAYETYMQELLFDPESDEISEYQDVHMVHSINVYGLASEQMDECRPRVEMLIDGEGKRRVKLDITNWVIETSSKEEAKSALEHEIRSLCHELSFECLEMSEEDKSTYTQRLEDDCVKIVLSRFDEEWKDSELI